MSAPEAKLSYDMKVNIGKSKTTIPLYQLFLKSAFSSKADGIIVGATYPEIIKYCNKKTKGTLYIYSPGIGTQGGDIKKVLDAGSNFLIVGRSILNAKNPVIVAREYQKLSISK
jgi:orotidine-5'-phosphate decarboxylase